MMNLPLPLSKQFDRRILAIRPLFFLVVLVVSTACDSLDRSERSTLATNDANDSELPITELYATSINEDASAKTTGNSSLSTIGQHEDAGFEPMPRSPMIADDAESSDLGATLFGNYAGMYPCSGCDAIIVRLNLYIDGSVLKTNSKMKDDQPISTTRYSGNYYQEGSIIVVTLDDDKTEYYYINNNRLMLLRGDIKKAGDNPESLSSPDYVLSRN